MPSLRDRRDFTITSLKITVFLFIIICIILIFSVVLYRPTPQSDFDRFIATHPLSNALKPKVKPIILQEYLSSSIDGDTYYVHFKISRVHFLALLQSCDYRVSRIQALPQFAKGEEVPTWWHPESLGDAKIIYERSIWREAKGGNEEEPIVRTGLVYSNTLNEAYAYSYLY
jgi:hypothetical protein